MASARTLLLALFFLPLPIFASSDADDLGTSASSECAVWDTRPHCLAKEGWPLDTPEEPVVLTVDTATNTAYLFKNGELVRKDRAATGMDKWLKHGKRQWLFRTPRGRLRVQGKIANPVWYKPDWAFIEEGKKIPAHNSPSRYVKGKLGRYALDLGDSILVHGTDDPRSLGKKASHGCIRLGDKMMQKVYEHASVGMLVYVY